MAPEHELVRSSGTRKGKEGPGGRAAGDGRVVEGQTVLPAQQSLRALPVTVQAQT